ncbi:enoyl-CoA hydratase/isomerase family protein [Brevibacterium sp. 50QC2O2]|uniref:enoyl-CoA hydratase/isomerase family protein n=1 Tax=Brevibacterium TaxID=1696 RepID=UPI00211CE1C0|nr:MULTISPECIES: enoyl-CoA hydratase/isomerase family protein [unclassified Brevibacterium]MCQ9368214.1 enoyl-CoA hydratase/isomerase family protein [Brevibacterium sp. 91QC2O2]MCQ9385553.1 enoyl-CoA hydratase/isomerase family protein [Brevibacterium sp. 68QC2CO]MCQ9389234.1 enoyl-CoA hydratase/isomerase family protein [Brevibacterium sp. 50QC2O2]
MSSPYRPTDLPGFGFDIVAGVATLTIDRTDKRNALSRPMWRALPEIVAGVDADDSIAALIITGAGGHFSAGSDIADLNVPLADFWELNSAAEAALAAARTPTLAAIEGNCVGGGTELAAACDIRIAAPGSIFGVTAAKLGLVYPPGPTRSLARVLGESWARYLLLSAKIVDFDTMDRLGFFHETAADPLQAAGKLAERIAGLSSLSQTGAKAILAGELDEVDAPPAWLDAAYRTEIEQGQAAFFAKERPDFSFRRSHWQG